MCIISVEPKGLRNNKKDLQRMNACNQDGMGFAFSTGKKVIIKKFRSFDKFYPEYSQCKNLYGKTSAFMVHFRIRTHGTNKGTANVHPFRVNQDLVFSHNGTISGVGDSEKKSDTRLFNEQILRRLKSNFLKDKTQRKLIESFIGYSKLAFIDRAGRYEILNERKGLWSEGMWYSNETFKPKPKYEYGWGGGGIYGGGTYSTKHYPKRGGAVHTNTSTKPQAVLSLPVKKYQECQWCSSTSQVEKVAIQWMAGDYMETEIMCGDCRKTATTSALELRVVK